MVLLTIWVQVQGPLGMEELASLSERPKWELSPVEQLKVAAYRRNLGNTEMRQGHPEKVPATPCPNIL